MANHDALIEQLRAWADELQEHVVRAPAEPLAAAHLAVVIVGMREVAADLERDQDKPNAAGAEHAAGDPYYYKDR